jgi:hypothetical protein
MTPAVQTPRTYADIRAKHPWTKLVRRMVRRMRGGIGVVVRRGGGLAGVRGPRHECSRLYSGHTRACDTVACASSHRR